MFAVSSEMSASLGEERECRSALDRWRSIADGRDCDPAWSGWYGVAKADAHDGGSSRIGRYRDTLPRLDGALASLTPNVVRRCCTACSP